jgi:hypothetical protein
LLDDVNLPPVVVDAAGAVLKPEDLTESHALSGAEPDSGAKSWRNDVEECEGFLRGGYSFRGAREAAQDGCQTYRLARVVRYDLVDHGGVHDDVENVEVGLQR